MGNRDSLLHFYMRFSSTSDELNKALAELENGQLDTVRIARNCSAKTRLLRLLRLSTSAQSSRFVVTLMVQASRTIGPAYLYAQAT